MKKINWSRMLFAAATFFAADDDGFAQWPGWGGKNRNFVADSKGLADSWPEGGPRKIWQRPLGTGYSSIAVVGNRLFTMYGEAGDEIVVALDANTGKSVWEHRYAPPLPEGTDPNFAKGPNSTPQVHNGMVCAFGLTGRLTCIDIKSGKPVWSHDLVAEFDARMPAYGFSTSPVVYKNSLILPVGGLGVGMMAFDLATGAVQWKKHDFKETYSSPILIQVDGTDELVLLTAPEVLGLNPTNGTIEWRYPFGTRSGSRIMTPHYGPDAILFISAGQEVGSLGLKLSRKNGKVNVENVWSNNRILLNYSSAVRSGNVIYAASGIGGPVFMTAVEAATGKLLWRERGFVNANVIYADGKLIALEENGKLSIGTATPKKFELKSKFQLFGQPADDADFGPPMGPTNAAPNSVWSTPTLVGHRLYARDKETIVALDLGAAISP